MLNKLKSFSDERGYIMIDQWGPSDVREFRSSWNVSARTAPRRMSMVRSFFELVAAKFDGSGQRADARPRIDAGIESLVVQLARENSGWSYDRIVGALTNLGHTVIDQTVGNILRRHGIAPAPQRKRTTTWSEFIRRWRCWRERTSSPWKY